MNREKALREIEICKKKIDDLEAYLRILDGEKETKSQKEKPSRRKPRRRRIVYRTPLHDMIFSVLDDRKPEPLTAREIIKAIGVKYGVSAKASSTNTSINRLVRQGLVIVFTDKKTRPRKWTVS